METMAMATATTLMMTMATRWQATKRVPADGNKEGNGDGGKSDGDGDK